MPNETNLEKANWTWRSTMYAAMFVYELILTALAVPSGHALAFVALVFFAAVLPLAVKKHLPKNSAYANASLKSQVVDMLSCAGILAALIAGLHQHFVIAVLAILPVIAMFWLYWRRKW
ncbi:MAG TPA: hypothetical protein VM581_04865 [Magnetospirillaceae bacterium]|nr:hypothetical protein [Magnetospirillaceae bacterium]